MVNLSSVFLFLILGTKVYNSLPHGEDQDALSCQGWRGGGRNLRGYGNSVIFTARGGWVKLGVKLTSHQGNVSAGKPFFFAHLTPQLIMHRTCSTASSPFVKVLRTLPSGCSYNFQCRAVSSSIFFMVGECTECAFPTQGVNVGK